jgi:chemotaxis protein MotB
MNALRRKVRRAQAWIVTFADLVTVVLAFFVLMLSFSATDTRQYDRGSDSMAAAFADDLGGVFDRVSPVRLGVPAARVLATEPEKTLARVTASLLRKIERVSFGSRRPNTRSSSGSTTWRSSRKRASG